MPNTLEGLLSGMEIDRGDDTVLTQPNIFGRRQTLGDVRARDELSRRTRLEMAERDRAADNRARMEDEFLRGLANRNPHALIELQRRRGAQTQQLQSLQQALLMDKLATGQAERTNLDQPIPGQNMTLRQLTTLTEKLKGLGEDSQHAILRQLIPNLPSIESKRDRIVREKIETEERQQRNREETFAFQNLGSYINKKTGESAMMAAKAPDLDTLKRDYVRLGSVQQTNVLALKGLDNQIAAYETLLPKLKFSEPGPGVIAGGLGIKAARLFGGEVTRKLDSIKAQITQLARAFGGDSRVSDKEMDRLESAVFKDFESGAGAQAALDTLKSFREDRARAIGIPGLINSRVTTGKVLTREKAQEFKERAGGDLDKASDLARAEGYER